MLAPPTIRVDFEIRLSVPEDEPYIFANWIGTMRTTYPNNYALDFEAKLHRVILERMTRTLTIVSHLPGEPDERLGFLTYGSYAGNMVVHFAYVEPNGRRQGIATEMVRFLKGHEDSPGGNDHALQEPERDGLADEAIRI